MPAKMDDVGAFMRRERLAAFCTVNSKGEPCVVPMYFTYVDGRVYAHTDRNSVKVGNIRNNDRVAIAVFHDEEAVIIRGTARVVEDDEFVVRTREHIDKYELQLDAAGKDSAGIRLFDSKIRCVLEVTPNRIMFW